MTQRLSDTSPVRVHAARFGAELSRAMAERGVSNKVLRRAAAIGSTSIALCGYDGEYDLPGWSVLHWKSKGGYSGQSEASSRARANSKRERVWFSPSCGAVSLWDVA